MTAPPEKAAMLGEKAAMLGLSADRLPRSVAIIMDGNGRWAEDRGLPRFEGHRVGAESVDEVVTTAAALGIEALTLYCFSTENWKRPQEEQRLLFELLELYVVEQRPKIVRENLRFRVIGDVTPLPESARIKIRETTEAAAGNDGMTLCLALNYGSRQEILRAVRSVAEDAAAGRLSPVGVTDASFSARLDTAGMPDPDLLIRTAGELRVSNFLLWQISYAELYVTSLRWPDFREEAFVDALRSYGSRDRRFGGLTSPPDAAGPA